MLDPQKLGDAATFEGKPVQGIAIEVSNISGGLNRAMPIDPVVVHQGDEVFLVARIESTKIRHEPMDAEDPAGPQKRVQIFRASTVGIASDALVDAVAEFLDAQREQIEAHEAKVKEAADDEAQRAKDAAAGQMRIDDVVESEPVSIPVDATDELAAKRGAKKSSAGTREVTPRPKAKKAPAKKGPSKRPRSH